MKHLQNLHIRLGPHLLYLPVTSLAAVSMANFLLSLSFSLVFIHIFLSRLLSFSFLKSLSLRFSIPYHLSFSSTLPNSHQLRGKNNRLLARTRAPSSACLSRLLLEDAFSKKRAKNGAVQHTGGKSTGRERGKGAAVPVSDKDPHRLASSAPPKNPLSLPGDKVSNHSNILSVPAIASSSATRGSSSKITPTKAKLSRRKSKGTNIVASVASASSSLALFSSPSPIAAAGKASHASSKVSVVSPSAICTTTVVQRSLMTSTNQGQVQSAFSSAIATWSTKRQQSNTIISSPKKRAAVSREAFSLSTTPSLSPQCFSDTIQTESKESSLADWSTDESCVIIPIPRWSNSANESRSDCTQLQDDFGDQSDEGGTVDVDGIIEHFGRRMKSSRTCTSSPMSSAGSRGRGLLKRRAVCAANRSREWRMCEKCESKHWSNEPCKQLESMVLSPSKTLEKRWTGKTTALLVDMLRQRTKDIGSDLLSVKSRFVWCILITYNCLPWTKESSIFTLSCSLSFDLFPISTFLSMVY